MLHLHLPPAHVLSRLIGRPAHQIKRQSLCRVQECDQDTDLSPRQRGAGTSCSVSVCRSCLHENNRNNSRTQTSEINTTNTGVITSAPALTGRNSSQADRSQPRTGSFLLCCVNYFLYVCVGNKVNFEVK